MSKATRSLIKQPQLHLEPVSQGNEIPKEHYSRLRPLRSWNAFGTEPVDSAGQLPVHFVPASPGYKPAVRTYISESDLVTVKTVLPPIHFRVRKPRPQREDTTQNILTYWKRSQLIK
jgi:hypothetical protein